MSRKTREKRRLCFSITPARATRLGLDVGNELIPEMRHFKLCGPAFDVLAVQLIAIQFVHTPGIAQLSLAAAGELSPAQLGKNRVFRAAEVHLDAFDGDGPATATSPRLK